MTQPLSSGRWDASGSWADAVEEQFVKSRDWAFALSLFDLRMAVMKMEQDVNAFTLYERKAILMAVQHKLWQLEESTKTVECSACNGHGSHSVSVLHPTNPNGDSWISSTCSSCKGTGKRTL